MKTFHADRKVKNKYLNRMKAHVKADELIQKETWDGSKGCAVGCCLNNYNHKQFEVELGIPEWAARLYDILFEGQEVEDAKKFAVDFLKVMPVGVDIEPVKWKFCAFVLKVNIERVLALAIDDKLKQQVVSAVRGCLALHENAILTGSWDESAASSAASAASSAARSAARIAVWIADSAVWSAVWIADSAARIADSAASSAVWSAASSADSAASSAIKKSADELLRLLKECK